MTVGNTKFIDSVNYLPMRLADSPKAFGLKDTSDKGNFPIFSGEECNELIGEAPNFNFDSVEGLVRCKVLPPRNLFHPVLPYRVRGKLLFALCRSCCEIFSQETCTHDRPDEREFEGTWVFCELRKAIEEGYLVTSVSEIWQYKVTRDDPNTQQGGLFAKYINFKKR
ncbi:hypothetical protein ALC57_17586 [Trachymyrmex cornetzi]|uniref:DNA-directed DNA polymerase n=1 Tax=Trachymyrmex cornetzi TaxID=471704 RepID=A0A151ITF8_9HYME|nr:hypothetical protein ALC57_17586 [Trachymyrmex cornetzi]